MERRTYTQAQLLWQLREIPWTFEAMALSAGGYSCAFVSASVDQQQYHLRGFDLSTRKGLFKFDLSAKAEHLVFSDDASFIAAALENGEVHIWSREGDFVGTIKSPGKKHLAFVPGSYLLGLMTITGELQCWDILPIQMLSSQAVTVPRRALAGVQASELPAAEFALSADGQQLALTSLEEHRVIRVWDRVSSELPLVFQRQRRLNLPKGAYPSNLGYMPQTHSLFGIEERTLRAWNTDTLQPLSSIRISQICPVAYCFSPDQHHVAIADWDGKVCIWSLLEHQVVMDFEAHSMGWMECPVFPAISHLSWHDDGIITAGWLRWENPDPKPEQEYRFPVEWSTVKSWRLS